MQTHVSELNLVCTEKIANMSNSDYFSQFDKTTQQALPAASSNSFSARIRSCAMNVDCVLYLLQQKLHYTKKPFLPATAMENVILALGFRANITFSMAAKMAFEL